MNDTHSTFFDLNWCYLIFDKEKSVFVDVLVKLERIVDHSIRVAKNVNASSKEVTLKAELGLAE